MTTKLFLFSAALLLAAHLTAAAPDPGINVDYFSKLRFDFAARKDYAPDWSGDPDRHAVYEAARKNQPGEVIRLGKVWLAKNPVDAEVYLLLAICQKQTGDVAGYYQSISWFYGLLRSITATGDGRTPETAFKVIAVPEEYFLIRDLGADVEQQALVDHYDKMDLKTEDGRKFTLYFDVSISLEATARELGAKPAAAAPASPAPAKP
jgi:Domain of unknown function (DUF4919)